MNWRAVLAFGVVAVVGCSADDEGATESYLLMAQPDVGTLDAPLDATVSIEDDCVLLVDDGAGRTVYRATWPAGTVFDPETDTLVLPDGDIASDGDRVVGSGGAEGTLDEISDEAMDRVFVESTFSDFARTCRQDDVTAARLFFVGFVEAGG